MEKKKKIEMIKLKDIFADVENPPYTERTLRTMAKNGQIKAINVGLGKKRARYMVSFKERDRIRGMFGL